MITQALAPHLDGTFLTGVFGLCCVVFSIRFAFPSQFRPLLEQPPRGWFRPLAGMAIGGFSGLAG